MGASTAAKPVSHAVSSSVTRGQGRHRASWTVWEPGPVEADDRARLAEAIAEARARTTDLLDGLQRTYTDIVDAAEMSNNDDEHDPDGSTVAYERAQVWALLR